MMDIKDAIGNNLEIGDNVTYVPTGTNGEIEDVRIQDEKYWVKIANTDMWYITDKVELLSDKEIKDTDDDTDIDKINKEGIDKIKERREELAHLELQDEVAEGGG